MVPAGRVDTTAVTAAELRCGALHSGRRERNLARAESFLRPLRVVPFDDQAAILFARIKEHLVRQGSLIGTADLFIAACTLAVGGTLVTNNVRELARVPGLLWENWAESAESEESP